jgi:predicted DNA-binding protein
MERLLGRKAKKVKSILKEKKNPDHKLVGTYFPLRVYTYLTMFTLAKGVTRTYVLKEIINKWIEDQLESNSEKALIQEIIKRSWQRWVIQKVSGRIRMPFIKFMSILSRELKRNHLPENIVNQIIEGVNQCYAKDQEIRHDA